MVTVLTLFTSVNLSQTTFDQAGRIVTTSYCHSLKEGIALLVYFSILALIALLVYFSFNRIYEMYIPWYVYHYVYTVFLLFFYRNIRYIHTLRMRIHLLTNLVVYFSQCSLRLSEVKIVNSALCFRKVQFLKSVG